MWFSKYCFAGILLAFCTVGAYGQDEGVSAGTEPEAATYLYLWNNSDQSTLFTLERPADSFTTGTIKSTESRWIRLPSTRDDFVLIASKPGNASGTSARPYQVFATSHFNASEHPSTTIGAGLDGSEADGYQIIYWLRENNNIIPLDDSEESRRFIEQNKEKINRAIENAKEETQVSTDSCAAPATEIPQGGPKVNVDRIYFTGSACFDLHGRKFAVVLFDSPAALGFKGDAVYLGSDECFTYWETTVYRTKMQYAFTIHPERRFEGHSIWSRQANAGEWRREQRDVIMAGVNPSTTKE